MLSGIISYVQNAALNHLTYWTSWFRPPPAIKNCADSDLIELSKCCICYESYNKTNRVPITVPCGHTFCKTCMLRVYVSIMFQCCVCREVSLMGFGKIGKNLALMQIFEKAGLLADDDKENASTPFRINSTAGPHYMNGLENIDPHAFEIHTRLYLTILKEFIYHHNPDYTTDEQESLTNEVVVDANRLKRSLRMYFNAERSRQPSPGVPDDDLPEVFNEPAMDDSILFQPRVPRPPMSESSDEEVDIVEANFQPLPYIPPPDDHFRIITNANRNARWMPMFRNLQPGRLMAESILAQPPQVLTESNERPFAVMNRNTLLVHFANMPTIEANPANESTTEARGVDNTVE
uniref:RING-type domain-containing protein n=1 Tax=Panagrellus redivivus TaxID=6233 RepID=A0A7E4ZRA8_PANRE